MLSLAFPSASSTTIVMQLLSLHATHTTTATCSLLCCLTAASVAAVVVRCWIPTPVSLLSTVDGGFPSFLSFLFRPSYAIISNVFPLFRRSACFARAVHPQERRIHSRRLPPRHLFHLAGKLQKKNVMPLSLRASLFFHLFFLKVLNAEVEG